MSSAGVVLPGPGGHGPHSRQDGRSGDVLGRRQRLSTVLGGLVPATHDFGGTRGFPWVRRSTSWTAGTRPAKSVGGIAGASCIIQLLFRRIRTARAPSTPSGVAAIAPGCVAPYARIAGLRPPVHGSRPRHLG